MICELPSTRWRNIASQFMEGQSPYEAWERTSWLNFWMLLLVRSRGEWDKLAKWVVNNKLFSDNVRWLIQIPRLYEVFKASGTVESFGDVVQSRLASHITLMKGCSLTCASVTSDIFQPLFEVTKDPRTHPELHVFLQRVIGFDSVDDESKSERRLYRSTVLLSSCQNGDSGLTSIFLQSIPSRKTGLPARIRLIITGSCEYRLFSSAYICWLGLQLSLRQYGHPQQLETRARFQWVLASFWFREFPVDSAWHAQTLWFWDRMLARLEIPTISLLPSWHLTRSPMESYCAKFRHSAISTISSRLG